MDENPYRAPQRTDASPFGSPKLMVWAAGVLVVLSILGALGGLAIGLFVGMVFPGYYCAVAAGGGAPGFDPVAFGVGAGVTQGAGAGLFGALVIVALFYRYRAQSASKIGGPPRRFIQRAEPRTKNQEPRTRTNYSSSS